MQAAFKLVSSQMKAIKNSIFVVASKMLDKKNRERDYLHRTFLSASSRFKYHLAPSHLIQTKLYSNESNVFSVDFIFFLLRNKDKKALLAIKVLCQKKRTVENTENAIAMREREY